MICPEVWNFSPPAYNLKFTQGNWQSSNDICNVVNKHHFNHLVSVVLPDTLLVPENLIKLLSEDCDYYKVHDFLLTALLDPSFLRTFVKSGHLSALSVGTRVDCDNCMAVTSSGHLILSLLKEFYEELGLEGKPSSFCRKNRKPTRYLVVIDLKDLDPRSKKYERISCAFSRFQSKQKFNLILAWDPPNGNEEILPSSVATYLVKEGIQTTRCSPKFKQRHAYNVQVPTICWDNEDEGCEPNEILEWLGAFSLEISLDGEHNDFVNSYHVPENTVLCGQTAHLQCTGFFTTRKISAFLESLQKYISTRKFPWASVHVAGFEDAPVSPGLTEHRWYGALGDISYTIFYNPFGKYIVSTLSASQKLLKH